jgi:hypothetical protein
MNTTFRKDLYQMVLQRPVEPAGIIGNWPVTFPDGCVLSSSGFGYNAWEKGGQGISSTISI